MRRLLREPLLHFILLGAVLFAAFGWWSEHSSTDSKSIVITQGRIDHLVNTFTQTWQRPPSQQELQGLIQDYIREEVCVREALALGLDRDDIVIRRRLRQKMEFVSEDLASQAQPSDNELQAYLKAHPATFTTEPRFTFRQVYIDPKRHSVNLESDTHGLLARLKHSREKRNLDALGDPIMLDYEFRNASASEVRNAFGEKFAAALGNLSPHQWQGPIESGYGVHLVFLEERTEGLLPPLEDVREAVRREWANSQRLEATTKLYQALLQPYSVTVEGPNLAVKKQEVASDQR